MGKTSCSSSEVELPKDLLAKKQAKHQEIFLSLLVWKANFCWVIFPLMLGLVITPKGNLWTAEIVVEMSRLAPLIWAVCEVCENLHGGSNQ